jgi:valyl-tRNA synthetase
MYNISQGRDVNLDIKRVVGYRQFCNKLWNAVKFALVYIKDFNPTKTMHMDILKNTEISKRDLYILNKLNEVIKECNKNINEYTFGIAVNAIHSFFLYDVCDLYLELMKPIIYNEDENNKMKIYCAQVTLYTVLEQSLRYVDMCNCTCIRIILYTHNIMTHYHIK